METLFNSICNKVGLKLRGLATVTFLLAHLSSLQATPQEWIYFFESDNAASYSYGMDPMKQERPVMESSLALSCKPEVNVSLGQFGYAVLTSIMLVNAPDYPPFLYDVDIMGPLNDTVFCDQIGQELMVIVTELPTGNSCMSTVFVEDKLKPVLTCLPDTLPCTVNIAEIDFENFVDVTDNCDEDPTLFFSYAVQNLPCNPGGLTQQILILWTAIDDSGNSITCQDVIYLEKPSLSEIEFPNDTAVSCLNPNIDPSVTGEPTIDGEPISLACQLLVSHTDQVVPMCNGAQKIIRLWTVRDLCTGAQITDVQIILIIDNVPPVLICPANLTIGTDPGVCTTKYTLPFPVVSDACAGTGMIDIDIFVSSVPGIFSPGQMINLGLGISTITIRATDPCNNSSMCSYTVTVRDNTPPIPICHSLTVGLGPDGMATIFANLLDFIVIENCGILSKQIWRMTNTCGVPEDLLPGPDVKFCCADAGDTIMVAFKVTDLSGNMNTCMFQVFVKDQLPPTVDCEDITISVTNQSTIVVEPSDVVTSASDNCFVVDTTVIPNIFDCDDIGENVVIVTVTDQSGNTATCTATVTIVDEVPPVALCQNVTVTLNAMGVAVISVVQVNNGSSDNCEIDTMFLSQFQFDCDDAGINIVVLTVTDLAGNTATCTATITVLTTPPVAICQNFTAYLNIVGTVTILAGNINNGSFDDCGIETITVVPPTFDCTDLGPNLVVLTVTDSTGNSSTCTAIVTVLDTIPPIALCQDISIMLDSNGMAIITADSINNGSTDNCFIVSLSIDSTEFNCEEAGDNIVTLTVTDQSGNTSTCTANVMVMMPDPPTAICQDITVTLGPGGIVVITPEQIDNGSFAQCGDVTLTIDVDSFDCTDIGSGNIVTLTVTDETFASATCTATVTVEEGPPFAICQNITVSLIGNTVTITGEQINNNSTDDCGIVDYDVTPATFDCTDLGPNTVILTVTDGSGNTSTCTAIVTVEDNTDPIAVCQDITVAIGPSGIVIITGIQINNGSTDNCGSGTLTFTADPDTLDCDNVGPNIVTLTVTDQSGNTSTCTAIVTVTSTPPVAVCQDITVSIGVNGIIIIAPIAVDGGSTSTCGDLEFTLNENTFDCTELGENIVILTVSNGSASDTCTATITVVDDTAPICSAADITVFLNAAGTISILPGQINDGSTDNCEIDSISVTPDDFTCDDLGPNTVTLTVTDQSGNSSTCTATVTVMDTISPLCSTQNITVSITSGSITILPSQVNNGSSDNCGPVTLDVDPDTFTCDDLGPNTVVLTVTDGSGNSSTCTATVTVTESGGLVANCQNVTIFVDINGNASVDPESINNGSGGGCSPGDLTFELSQTEFNCTDLGPNIVILTVTDTEGNTATCTATVTVADNIPPTIICPANVTVECNSITDPNNTGQFGNATANDNCPGVSIQENAVFNLNNCNVGTITRTFTATDASGNTAVCTQVVTFVNSNPFTEDDITWPPSPITVNICNSTDPDDLPNGEPVFDPASQQCANPVANFSDQVQTIIDNDPNTPCKIITRTWTVTDNCQPGVSFVFVQTINVIDTAPPVFTNINDMTKVANASCVAFFTLIASATDCAGVTITNNSPFGVNSGANASGNYPIGQTTVLFTATDGCGNTSTMDVVLTVTDPDPTEFQCEKVIVILPEELEITLNAETFVLFFPGNCTNEDDFIVSYSDTDPFDTTNIYDCGDVGVTTFPLWFWNLSGTLLVDSCSHADLDLRDPDDLCGDGLVILGNVENEDGLAVGGVDVHITNTPMIPATTNSKGLYVIEGLNQGIGYDIAPFKDNKHRVGVSTLDLVLIQKHLLGRAKLNSPYKMIAADANKSGHITALDLLEIRKLILGLTSRFPNNTSWRFVDRAYSFTDPYNPFNETFAESIWIDSVNISMGALDFVGVKIGDVNGSYFLSAQSGPKIEPRSSTDFNLEILRTRSKEDLGTIIIKAVEPNGSIDGLQFSLYTGGLTDDQVNAMSSEVFEDEDWHYDAKTGAVNVSWTTNLAQDIKGKILFEWPADKFESDHFDLTSGTLNPEAYDLSSGLPEVKKVVLSSLDAQVQESDEYHLFQNKPNPFVDGTVISFVLPQTEDIRLVIYDITGRQVWDQTQTCSKGRTDVMIKSQDLKLPGIYYYTLYTSNASFTRKMSFTNN